MLNNRLLSRAKTIGKQQGLKALVNAGMDELRRSVLALSRDDNDGLKILNQDWDNLLILDACRFDTFAEENELPGNLKEVQSRGSDSREFVERALTERDARDIVCISANPYYGRYKDELDFYKLIGLWTEAAQNEGFIPAEKVRDVAQDALRNHPRKRLLVHFMQPHTPFVYREGQKQSPESPYWNYIRIADSDVSPDTVRSLYRENLRYILDIIGEMLEQLQGKTVVTSDHGELLGETIPRWMQWFHPGPPKRQHLDNAVHHYGHAYGLNRPELLTVPWLEYVSGSRREIERGKSAATDVDTANLDEHLRALGYRD